MTAKEVPGYAYSAAPTRNPLRYAAAAWRLVRRDPAETLDDAAVVEIGFNRSRLGRRFARWEETFERLSQDPALADVFEQRPRFGPIDLEELEQLPPGSLGFVFAGHCRARSLDPNLVHIPPDDDVGWLVNRMYQTHDLWHVLTGWGNDLAGEVGLGGFYCAQLRSPTFFGYMLALVLLNVISRRADLDEILAAFVSGYRGGRAARPLFGADWAALFPLPIGEVRQRFAIDRSEIVGEGVRDAA
jgi:ubiquinone biosynthesis protein COQ4